MALDIDPLKNDLIDRIAAETGSGPGAPPNAAQRRFVAAYYANVGTEDIAEVDPALLAGAALSLLALGNRRRGGESLIALRRPGPDATLPWGASSWSVDCVNDDMPFLVESVSAALERMGMSARRLIHPIVKVRRDRAGLIEDLGTGIEGNAESFMHIELDHPPEAGPAALEAALEAVLCDVRAVAADRGLMAERLDGAQARIESGHGAIPAGEMAEAGAFLGWCRERHFTLFGYRRYLLDEGSDGIAVTLDPASGLGVLRSPERRLFDERRDLAALPAQARAVLARPEPLLLTKSDGAATVRRAVPMDIVCARRFGPDGRAIGLDVFAGLYADTVYTVSPSAIPLVRRKIACIVERSGLSADSHDGRSLRAVLEHYPRDELIQAGKTTLEATALAILRLRERRRVALFVREDLFERFVTVQVFVPRESYDSRFRLAAEAQLTAAYQGHVAAWYTEVTDNPMARLSFTLRLDGGYVPAVDLKALEARLDAAARSWADGLQEALIAAWGESRGLALFRRFARAFPAAYVEGSGATDAVEDIERIDAMADGLAVRLYDPRPGEGTGRLKIYRAGEPVPLSDVLPLLEHMGFRVLSEDPYRLSVDGRRVVVQDFRIVFQDAVPTGDPDLPARVALLVQACWQGLAEDDGLNRLVVTAGLSWRQVAVLRAYSKYLRQAGSPFTQSYVQNSVAANGAVAALLLRLFETRFDPAFPSDAPEILASIDKALEGVSNADEDRILRRFLELLEATLRTNYFQRDEAGQPKAHLALKLDSRRIPGLPAPRPMVEIFVYSPRVEGIHLRGGRVARGGIRWSDRPEDFRTEILGLLKAQMVKNAVIVPVGSKGGFIVKRPPPSAGRDALMEEGIACYKIFIGGLLDLTDNLVAGQVVPPADTARRDGDDPYLVVAADKGTATFSDIANSVSAAYGFWLGDAFASGGSQGYDHKAMGITARGAWESVRRHFREMGQNVESDPFTVVGVGDMSGDVFGNGMLRSRAIRLVAAFDHRHIFIDPDPDPDRSYDERARLFALPRSSWADYDRTLLSPGGQIYPRTAKVVRLSREAQDRFGIETDILTPHDLIRRLLKAPVDLLWFGGIGTYVKAAAQSQAEAGDRANDGVRVDGRDLVCKVVAEGANLAMTQAGRIEYALAGGRINTDAIDNSAGVDCSDHEVNIKILLGDALTAGILAPPSRNPLLAEMTDAVAGLVLRDNILQNQAISVLEAQAPQILDRQDRFMRFLEKAGRLDRAVETLPNDEELARRAHGGRGLTRPEIAVLLAYGKLWLYDAILDSDLPDDPALAEELVRYFPARLDRPDWHRVMGGHRLRREIVATVITNSITNRIGGSRIAHIVEATGATGAEVTRAYMIVRDGFGLKAVWAEIEALEAPAAVQTALLVECNRLLERGIGWVLSQAGRPLDIGRLTASLAGAVAALEAVVPAVLPPDTAQQIAARAADYAAQGVPPALADRVAHLIVLVAASDIAAIAAASRRSSEEAGRLYFLAGTRFGPAWLRAQAERLGGTTHWQKLAVEALIDELHARQAMLAGAIARHGGAPEEALSAWIAERAAAVDRADQLLGELKTAGALDLAGLVVAGHQLAGLGAG